MTKDQAWFLLSGLWLLVSVQAMSHRDNLWMALCGLGCAVASLGFLLESLL